MTDPFDPGFHSYAVSGYKSIFDRMSIDVSGLVVIAGSNSSGKSSITQPLLLVKQTLDAPADAGPLKIAGPNVRFSNVSQMFSKRPRVRPRELEIEFGFGRDASVTARFVLDKAKGLRLTENVFRRGNREVSVSDKATAEESLAALRDFLAEARFFSSLLHRIDQETQLEIRREACFYKVTLNLAEGVNVNALAVPNALQQSLRGIIHVQGLRGNPAREYQLLEVSPPFFAGTFEQYVASVIAFWQETDAPELRDVITDIRKLGLTWTVRASKVSDTSLQVQVGRLPLPQRGGAKDFVNIADVGLGMSQVLPVIVALRVAAPGQTVIVEQPEIHLHPRAQGGLAEILAAAALRGVRVIVETHSSLLLLSLQTLVAEARLDPEEVSLLWVQRNTQGVTSVSRATIDSKGSFGDWPVDFTDTLLESEDRFLRAHQRRLFDQMPTQ